MHFKTSERNSIININNKKQKLNQNLLKLDDSPHNNA